MTKFPFTPDGVAAMCQYYYQLPDAALQIAAEALGQNLPLWVSQNFLLTVTQEEYLFGIAPQALNFMAGNAEFALANRRPIILFKDVNLLTNKDPETEPGDSKVTKPKSKLSASILPNGEILAEGEFEIAITY